MPTPAWIDDALSLAGRKALRTAAEVGEAFPHVSEGGSWQLSPVQGWEGTPSEWTAGYWPGTLWELAAATRDDGLARLARHAARRLRRRLAHRGHDLGHLFWPACARGYELTGDPALRLWALVAARRLTGLALPCGWITLAPGSDRVAADTWMNLVLLTWSAREGRERDLHQTAMGHFRRASSGLIRPDGSTVHLARVDRTTGQILETATRQGLAPDSCWSRGLAWTVAGLTTLRAATGAPWLEEPLRRVLGYLGRRLAPGEMPLWDFDAGPEDPSFRDSSAAAILAWSLLTPGAEDLPVGDTPARLWAFRLLESLTAQSTGDDEPGLLRHGCFHVPQGLAVDSATIWGDFFFAAALGRARQACESGEVLP